MDKYERKELIKKKTIKSSVMSVGCTWVDGRIIFKEGKKWSNTWFGICHFSDSIFSISPLDYEKPTMITTILVSPTEAYCERSGMCLAFNCKLNRFNKDVFLSYFKDIGLFTAGLPQNIGREPLWFNDGKWKNFWGKICQTMKPEGGTMKYKES
uniref:Uncharacterized protein n=1 Tax=viral metagenome TaxID=1070528 RepID=A0A6H1Z989_9ZZZZ